MTVSDENELIRRAKAGDRAAFCHLVRAHERRLHAFALALCQNAADAEDLSQDAWLKAFQGLHRFRGECPFYAWVRQIMLNRYLSGRRDSGLEVEVPVDELRAPDPGLDERLLVQHVWGALGSLSPQERLVLMLRHREEMKMVEIAGTLGCSTGAVKKALHRAVHKLRVQLSPALVRK